MTTHTHRSDIVAAKKTEATAALLTEWSDIPVETSARRVLNLAEKIWNTAFILEGGRWVVWPFYGSQVCRLRSPGARRIM